MGLIPLNYPSSVSIRNHTHQKNSERQPKQCVRTSIKNRTPPGMTGMVLGTQRKREKPFAAPVKVTAVIPDGKPGAGLSNW